VNTPQEQFLFLVGRVLDGEATADERATFRSLLREHPELIDAYREQTDMDTLASWKFGSASREFGSATPPSASPRRKRPTVFWRRTGVRFAAAAAVLLTGAALWRGAWRASPPSAPLSPSSALRPPSSAADSPVTVVARKDAWGLELPQALPGQIRLAKGEIKVRLPSGVELVLLSPLELQVENDMEVRLTTGRLVAWVPRRACGFTVHAPGLTAWDIGTVFSVAAEETASDLFVFKGSVQVLDSEGNGVDLCEAGEGVRAPAGKTPFKVAAEGAEAERMLRAVRGYAALDDLQRALRAARQVCEQWTAKYVPEEASRVREAARRQAALRNAPRPIPFTKTAWVRPAAPMTATGGAKIHSSEQEASNMKTTSAAALAAVAMAGAGMSGAESAPILVDTSPVHNRHWTTAFTNEIPLRWNWVTNADSAELAVTGMNGSFMTNFTDTAATSWVWPAFASAVPAAEDVYDLTLTFKDNQAIVGVLTSKLTVVTAAFGQSKVIPTPEDKPWPSVKENAVIPYDAEWAEATADATASRVVIAKQGGIIQTNALADASGYLGWKLRRSDWGYGTFTLALTFPGTVTNAWDATLVRNADGMMIKVR